MTLLFLDCETTTYNNGNPFDERNFLVCAGWRYEGGYGMWYGGSDRSELERVLAQATTLVFFNAKFDLHWLRKAGFDFSGKRIFCCQVAEFFLSRQTSRYPSLDNVAASYGISGKFDRVKLEYWDKGIQTDQIPRPILTEYCLQDIKATGEIYYKQQERIQPHQRTLMSLQMQDLLVLEDIEFNGLYFNPEVVKAKRDVLNTEIAKIQELLDLYHTIPCFNWGSPAHLSALLYGGQIVEERRIPVGLYKSGAKVGQPRFAIEKITHTLPRMYKPPKGSELKKEGIWSVDEDNLLKIKGGKKELIQGILKLKELGKLQSTYVDGMLSKHQEMHWPPNMIHGQYNQVVAGTGRLSSSNPNMQNMSGDILDMFETRWK